MTNCFFCKLPLKRDTGITGCVSLFCLKHRFFNNNDVFALSEYEDGEHIINLKIGKYSLILSNKGKSLCINNTNISQIEIPYIDLSIHSEESLISLIETYFVFQ